ncbi:MAG: hypothetical protein AAGG01_15805, partial [Planctomycetota bacterium]
ARLAAASARVLLAGALLSLARERESKGARAPAQLLTAAWARRFALDLVQRTPKVASAVESMLKPNVSIPRGAHGPVLKALDRIGARALAKNDLGTAIRAGRIVKGMGVQADFQDLRGDRPSGMARWRAKGSELVDRVRERQAERGEKPWTVEELEWLATDEGETFTRQHSDFALPGVAVSPRGYYRVESDCGYETLLAVARTVEDHHERLVDYFGEDPFVARDGTVERQGTVRIVPDPNGLESEGAPFFWVGGFQGGDTTVIRHSAGTVEGLGRTLTHELTHRFDGALHRGIPAWLAEGRAVWTGSAYARIEDRQFVSNYCSFGSMMNVYGRGQHRPHVLEKILSGTPGDYRQNYSCGNALYVFLSTWFEGEGKSMAQGTPLFGERLSEYENSGKHPSDPDDLFEQFLDTFCDGEDGRPGSFEEFQEMFAGFLVGFNARKRAPFARRYVSRMLTRQGKTWIYDEPTWTWDWVRAEPAFGQNQAREAGALILEAGKPEDALRALAWARSVDGFDPRTSGLLIEAFEKLSKPSKLEREALWATRHERLGEPFAAQVNGEAARARLGPFPGDLRPVEACLKELRAVTEELRSMDAHDAAQRVASDAARVAAWAGVEAPALEALPLENAGKEAERSGAGTSSAAGPARTLASSDSEVLVGWRDEELTRLDQDRVNGLYFVEDDGTLLLGRDKPRTGSGRFDRNGGGRSFVRSSRWLMPGTYRMKTRVNFTTA